MEEKAAEKIAELIEALADVKINASELQDVIRGKDDEIRKLNGFGLKRKIHIHDYLRIPLDNISKQEFEEKRFEYHKKLQEDFFASYRVKDIESYQIKNGDNLWTLCQDVFEIPFWLFYKYNSKTNIYRLSPAQKLIIPRIEELSNT